MPTRTATATAPNPTALPATLRSVSRAHRIGSIWLDLWLEHRDHRRVFPSAPRSVTEGYGQSVRVWALWCSWGASTDPEVRKWGVRPAYVPAATAQPTTATAPNHPFEAAETAYGPDTPSGVWVWVYGEALDAALERKASSQFPGALVRAVMRGGAVGLPFTFARSGHGRSSVSPLRALTLAEATAWTRGALTGLPCREGELVPAVSSAVVSRLGRRRYAAVPADAGVVLEWLVGVVLTVWRGGFGGRPRGGV